MRFVSVRELRGRPAEVWTELALKGELVVTSNGKPIAILSKVSEDSLEQSLAAIRSARAVLAVTELQRRSERHGKNRLSPAGIEAEIQAVRRR